MANIKKSFNFRNGIQVDEDNLLVTSTGLVGIGTTVPKESLDVIGNVVVSGVTSSVFGKTGILTVTTINPTEIIGAGVSIQSGIITNPSMDNTGIVTYYGDGRYLQGLPTSQWQDTNAGFGVSSIYNTGGTVGIATTNPQFTLQVGDDVNSGQKGVGISSSGDIKVSGIITATGFVGNITGNVTGNISGNAGTATLADDAVKLQTARNIAGVAFDGSADITLPGVNSSGNQNTSGTAANLSGSPSITVSGIDLNGNLDVSGNTTLGDASSDTLTVNATSTFNQTITGIAGENKIPSLYSNMGALPNASSYHGMFAHVHATGKGYFAHAGNWIELVSKETTGIVGTGTETYSIGSLSIGTNSPANDVHLRKTGDTELQITSDTGTAAISIGRESGTSNTNNAEIRYGEDNGTNYSNGQSLDILNYGTGNFNYHLSANDHNAVNGDFHWHRGVNNVRLMTLTGIGGSLGIGLTVPQAELHVQGDQILSGDFTAGGNLNITGNLNANVNGNVTGNLTGDVNSTGTSTFSKVNFDITNYHSFGELQASAIGIGVTMANSSLLVNAQVEKQFIIATGGNVGIKTDDQHGNALYTSGDIASNRFLLIGNDGINANGASGAIDFSNAGKQATGVYANKTWMIPPKVGAAQTAALSGPVAGAMIYNTDLNKLQVYNGTNWETVTSVEVTG